WRWRIHSWRTLKTARGYFRARRDFWSVGHTGARNVTTTSSPWGPHSTTTWPPGTEGRVRFSPSGCDCMGMAPSRARNAARGSCCCAARPVAARASWRGISPSTRAPAPIAAIIRNHSRRVLLVTVRLTLHLLSRVPVQYAPGVVEDKAKAHGTQTLTHRANTPELCWVRRLTLTLSVISLACHPLQAQDGAATTVRGLGTLTFPVSTRVAPARQAF